MRPLTLLPICLLLAAIPGPGRGQALQDLQAIRDAALTALHAEPGMVAMLAPGLRLAACRQPLAAAAYGTATAEVRCPDTPGWRLYVPVRKPGTRSVRPPPDTVAAEAPTVSVKRGDPVVLRASIGGTEVRMGGKALGPATSGGILNVENDSSHRVIRGRLAADGTVEVVN